MKQTKHLTALLAVVLCTSAALASCGDQPNANDPVNTAAPDPVGTQAIETEDNRLPSSLPADLDFGGETLNIWYFTKNDDAAEHFMDLVGNPEGDIIETALYDRNVAMEEQLNIKLNYIDLGIGSGDVGNNIRKLIMAGDDAYDLYNVIQWNTSKLALEHCFLNLSDAPYLDLSQPWWSSSYIDALSIGQGNVFFLAGDISVDMIRCIGALYYNKNLFANLYDDANGVYQDVLDGKWTIDRLSTYVQEGYSDLNGNGTIDEDDRFGYLTNTYNNIDTITFGMGARLTGRDKDNMPYLTVADAHNVDVYEKTFALVYDTVGARANTVSDATLVNVQQFVNGRTLFVPGFLYTSENLRDMKDDYGIIPFPKYDESQENYISAVHDIATLMCLPTTCSKIEAVCATLEAMAYYSYYNVTPVYYETALKTKYTRDDISSQIIDILHDASMTDLAYVYSDVFNGDGMIMRTLIAGKNKDYASYYAKREKATNKALDKFITKFIESAE